MAAGRLKVVFGGYVDNVAVGLGLRIVAEVVLRVVAFAVGIDLQP